MGLPRPLLTTRRLLVLVAIAGVLAFGFWMNRLHEISGRYAPKVMLMRSHAQEYELGSRLSQAE